MRKFSKLVTLSALLCGGLLQAASQPLIKSGDSIAFMGDSITQFGADQPSGYVRLVISGLKVNGIDVKPYPAGRSGNKSNQMLARLDRYVLAKKPTWMTLSCGVNDVMHGTRGIELEPYKVNIRKLVEQTQQAGIKVMILTSTMISENKDDARNLKLDKYNVFLRSLAAEKGCPLADLNRDMKAAIEEAGGYDRRNNRLTRDGVHMDVEGDLMMAKGILRTFGLDEAMIAKADAYWLTMPEAVAVDMRHVVPKVSLQQKRQLEKIAAEKGVSLQQLLGESLDAYIKTELLKK
jgi:lysophospholipase L1-like esterase